MRFRLWLYYKVVWPLFRWSFQWAHDATLIEVQPGGAARQIPFPGGA